MIKELRSESFIQEIDGKEIEIRYDSLQVKNKLIQLPVVGNKIEVLCLNDAEDEHSIKVAKIFAKVASLN
jgi:hypothetical protein